MRKSRDGDLAYLADLPPDQARARCMVQRSSRFGNGPSWSRRGGEPSAFPIKLPQLNPFREIGDFRPPCHLKCQSKITVARLGCILVRTKPSWCRWPTTMSGFASLVPWGLAISNKRTPSGARVASGFHLIITVSSGSCRIPTAREYACSGIPGRGTLLGGGRPNALRCRCVPPGKGLREPETGRHFCPAVRRHRQQRPEVPLRPAQMSGKAGGFSRDHKKPN
jgi:hypothetical protein